MPIPVFDDLADHHQQSGKISSDIAAVLPLRPYQPVYKKAKKWLIRLQLIGKGIIFIIAGLSVTLLAMAVCLPRLFIFLLCNFETMDHIKKIPYYVWITMIAGVGLFCIGLRKIFYALVQKTHDIDHVNHQQEGCQQRGCTVFYAQTITSPLDKIKTLPWPTLFLWQKPYASWHELANCFYRMIIALRNIISFSFIILTSVIEYFITMALEIGVYRTWSDYRSSMSLHTRDLFNIILGAGWSILVAIGYILSMFILMPVRGIVTLLKCVCDQFSQPQQETTSMSDKTKYKPLKDEHDQCSQLQQQEEKKIFDITQEDSFVDSILKGPFSTSAVHHNKCFERSNNKKEDDVGYPMAYH